MPEVAFSGMRQHRRQSPGSSATNANSAVSMIEDRSWEARRVVAEAIALPPGHSLTWSGKYEDIERVQARLTLVAPATLAIITLMLFLAFNRLTEVGIILAALPVALAGGVWLVWHLGYDVSVAVLVGFIALAGVAVETAIVMLLYLNLAWDKRVKAARAERRSLGTGDVEQAVFKGALLRLRPNVVTVATIFAGLIPIMSAPARARRSCSALPPR